jgi:ammonia channel protein AmtB
VHGVTGIISGILPGIFAAGYIAQTGQAPINLLGQIGGVAISAILLGFIPGYAASWLLKKFNLLRVSRETEIEGLDLADMGVRAYPETAALGGAVEAIMREQSEQPMVGTAVPLGAAE